MPVLVDNRGLRRSASRRGDGAGECVIGIINNMPDAALSTTEQQFLGLLETAAEDLIVRVRFYSLPEVPRTDWGRRHVLAHYRDIADLWNSHHDGLIVTGTEPCARDLRNEPYWTSFAEIVDWAQGNAISTVWSCLAAHAAVLHLDGIPRRALSAKCFGVFECEMVCDHPLMQDVTPPLRCPHSRWNDLPEDLLRSNGYSILTRSGEAGVDTFARQAQGLFIFFQGHPEYETETLLREYRRDVRRYLKGEAERYPGLPNDYFDGATAQRLLDFRERAMSDRREDLLAIFPLNLVSLAGRNTWRPWGECIYRNWLLSIMGQSGQWKPRRTNATLALRG